MKQKPLQKKSYVLPSLIGISGLTALCVTSVFILTPQIQNNLARQVKETLRQENISVEIAVSGRNVTLRGADIDTTRTQLATKKTLSVAGVRHVNNFIKIKNTATDTTNIPTPPLPAREIDTPTEDRLTDANDPILEEPLELDMISRIDDISIAAVDATNTPEAEKAITIEKTTLADIDNKNTEPNENIASDKIISDLNKIIKLSEESPTKAISKNDKKPARLNKETRTLDYDTLLKAVNTLKQKKGVPVTTEVFSQDEKIDTSRILFDSKNKKQLSSSAQIPLNSFAEQILSSLKTFDIIVSEQSSETALEQARVIRNYLVSRGIEKNRMNIIGRGSTQYKVQFRPSS